MTTVHPRRALAEAEAAAWLELHADWASRPACLLGQRPVDDRDDVRGQRCPAEIPDVSARGALFHDCLGDGWDSLWWRTASRPAGTPASTPELSRVRCRPDSDYDQQVPTLERRRLLSGPAFFLAPGHEAYDADAARWGLGARRSAVTQLQRAGRLSDTTVALGQSVPAALLYDRAADCAIRRTTRVVRASALDSVPDASAPVSTWAADLAAAELLEWLRLEAGLTALEIESLQQRAAGVAQVDRSGATLARARRRALAALA